MGQTKDFMTPKGTFITAILKWPVERNSQFARRPNDFFVGRWCGAAMIAATLCTATSWAQDKPATSQPPAKAAASPPKASVKPPAKKTEKSAPGKSNSTSTSESDGERALQEIFACVAQGLPEGWKRAWVVVTELSGDGKERTFEGRFQVSMDATGDKRWNFVPCNTRDVAERVYRLNDFLEPEKRAWKVATLQFMSDGKFELKYDYTR
jgi:hypothetical protein